MPLITGTTANFQQGQQHFTHLIQSHKEQMAPRLNYLHWWLQKRKSILFPDLQIMGFNIGSWVPMVNGCVVGNLWTPLKLNAKCMHVHIFINLPRQTTCLNALSSGPVTSKSKNISSRCRKIPKICPIEKTAAIYQYKEHLANSSSDILQHSVQQCYHWQVVFAPLKSVL